MKEKLVSNLGLKLISVAIAFVIWLVVVNYSNPETTKTRTIPLEVRNEHVLVNAGKAYTIASGDSVVISYQVRTTDASRFTADSFRAYIDLADLYSVTGSVPVTVEVLSNQNLIIGTPTAKPSIVRVLMEDVQNKSFSLTTRTTGTQAEGYSVGSVTAKTDSVMVSGPVSLVGRVSSVGVIADVSGATEDIEGSAKVSLFDANGNEITIDDDRLLVIPSTVGYYVDMLRGKSLPLSFEVSGQTAPGFRFTGAECSVKSVAVIGEHALIESLDSLLVPGTVLDLQDASADRNVTVDLQACLPPGVTINGNATAVVTLKVEPLNRRAFQLSLNSGIEVTGRGEGLVYRLNPEIISVEVSALQETLDRLTYEDLEAAIDFGGLEPGTYTGTLDLTTPPDSSIASVTPFSVIVSEEGAGPGGVIPSGASGEEPYTEDTGEHEEEPSGAETAGGEVPPESAEGTEHTEAPAVTGEAPAEGAPEEGAAEGPAPEEAAQEAAPASPAEGPQGEQGSTAP